MTEVGVDAPNQQGSDLTSTQIARAPDEKINLVTSIPFFVIHLLCLLAFVVDFNWKLPVFALALTYVRMFFVTLTYHRYLSHRTFKTSRVFQFILAFIATTSAQKGVLWWAAHHRHHHKESDQDADIHSPTKRGFWWSHVGWILCNKYEDTKFESIKDFAVFPELRLLNKYHLVPPFLLGLACFLIGGWSLLIWFFISTTLLWHFTFTINSLSHVFGTRRYRTTDTSRNNWLLALITCGEGWHNNHHYHQNTANQGWFWWEIDLTYYGLKVFSWLGLCWDLKTPSDSVKFAYKRYAADDVAGADALVRGAATPAPLLKRQ
jgi:stearoyl-CoA desaturase (Delta-9 desaturase)